MMAQQVPAKPQASNSRAQRNSAIQQQIFKTVRRGNRGNRRNRDSHSKFCPRARAAKVPVSAPAPAWRRNPLPNNVTPRSITNPFNAIRGHATAHARLGFETSGSRPDLSSGPPRRARNPLRLDHVCVAPASAREFSLTSRRANRSTACVLRDTSNRQIVPAEICPNPDAWSR